MVEDFYTEYGRAVCELINSDGEVFMFSVPIKDYGNEAEARKAAFELAKAAAESKEI